MKTTALLLSSIIVASAGAAEPFALWTGGEVPKSADIRAAEGVVIHPIKPSGPGSSLPNGWIKGVDVAWHKGVLFASFGSNVNFATQGENSPGESAVYLTSRDGGATWGPVEIIAKGESDGAVSHGVFHSHEGELWTFNAAFSGKLRDLHIRAYVLEESSGKWQSRGRVCGDGLWPLQKPMKLPNGNWIMSCLRVGQGTAAAVAISHGTDFTRWDPVIIPRAPGKMWGESALLRDGDRLINIARYGEEALALVAVSHDWGRTWTPSQPSNLPMTTSKPYAGRLSTGHPYLICTTTSNTGTARNPLTIAVGEPGGSTFTRVLALDRREKTGLMYPGADEYQGKLYVGYTIRPNGGTDAPMLAVVPVSSLAGPAATAERATALPLEHRQARDARTEWFRDARYGLFIHWGLYAVPAGSYQGRKVDRSPTEGNGLGEWIMHNAKIPVAEYAQYARQFNPVKFDADAWVRLAAEAGMKYIVITTKHHDGFAMFKSAASPFNIVDATPFRRDPLKELAEACARHGIKLGFYYSHAQDWHHAGGAAWGRGSAPWAGGDPAIGHWDPAQAGSFDDYLDKVAIPQVRELLTNYGPISVLWWDTPVGMTPERSVRLAELLKMQPQLVTNNRLLNPRELNPYSGDTETPEQFIPATGFKDRLFEVCMTMNETWGYKAHDHEWKPAADITRKLIDIASKGGNFLLNVGPTAEGEIPAPSVERLRESGRWVKLNGEAIYGTTASLFRRLPWGRSTTKGKSLYLHVFDWPEDGRLIVPGLKSKVRRASLLGGLDSLPTVVQGGDVVVTLSGPAPDPVASVIKLGFDTVPIVDQPLPGPNPAGVIDLPANLAAIVNAYGANTRLMGSGSAVHVGAWDRVGTALTWEFSGAAGKYRLEAEVAAVGEAALGVACDSAKSVAKIAPTGGFDEYRFVALGSVSLGAAAEHNLELKSQGKTWSEVRLRRVRLVPVQ